MTRVRIEIEENQVVLTNMDPGDPRITGLKLLVMERFGVVFAPTLSVDNDNPRKLWLSFAPDIPEDRADDAMEYAEHLEGLVEHVPTPPPPTLEDVTIAMANGIKTAVDAQFLEDLDAHIAQMKPPLEKLDRDIRVNPPLTEAEMTGLLVGAPPSGSLHGYLVRAFAELLRLRESVDWLSNTLASHLAPHFSPAEPPPSPEVRCVGCGMPVLQQGPHWVRIDALQASMRLPAPGEGRISYNVKAFPFVERARALFGTPLPDEVSCSGTDPVVTLPREVVDRL